MQRNTSRLSCAHCAQRLRPWHVNFCSEACYEAGAYALEAPRFWSHVDTRGECWLWTASCTAKGYGYFRFGSKRNGSERNLIAPRFSWALVNGPIPDGMNVLHRCDTPACVRPAHLFLGTKAENSADMVAKGRHIEANRVAGQKRRGLASGKVRLTLEEMVAIRTGYAAGVRAGLLAARYGVTRQLVWKIGTGKHWTTA